MTINPTNGQIKTSKRLTGKGRSDPYEMKVRAEDNGEPGMFTDVKLSLYISDIIENDGVPNFVHPTADEIAYISEVRQIKRTFIGCTVNCTSTDLILVSL